MKNIIIAIAFLAIASFASVELELCLDHDVMPSCASWIQSGMKAARSAMYSDEPVYASSASRSYLLNAYKEQCRVIHRVMEKLDGVREFDNCHIDKFTYFLDKCNSIGWSYGACATFWNTRSKELDREQLIKIANGTY